MTALGVAPVDVAGLRVLRELGAGTQGRVTLVEGPGFLAGPLAYKEYTRTALAEADTAALGRLTELPARVDSDTRALLETRTAWPIATVHRDGEVCGFLMRAAPAGLAARLRLPGGRREHPLAMEFLLNPPEYMATIGLPVTERTRIALLREVAAVLMALHRERIVLGDISPKNVLVSLNPARCFLLDCDSARVDGHSAFPQLETPDWRLPAGEELGTEAGDRYKFGLLALRLLVAEQTARDPGALRAARPVLAPLAGLAARSLGESAARPSWDEWLTALDAAAPLADDTVPRARTGRRRIRGRWLGGRSFGRRWFGRRRITAPGWRPALAGAALATVLFTAGWLAGGIGGHAPGGTPEAPRRDTGVVHVAIDGRSPDTVAVALFLDRYFRAINGKDWNTLLALYDPAGDAKGRRSFIRSLSTTRDRYVSLNDVAPRAGQVDARVTFVSDQDRGFGPPGSPDETCTRWDVTFLLTRHGQGYRMLRTEPPRRHQPC